MNESNNAKLAIVGKVWVRPLDTFWQGDVNSYLLRLRFGGVNIFLPLERRCKVPQQQEMIIHCIDSFLDQEADD